jgi:hypothetical protein
MACKTAIEYYYTDLIRFSVKKISRRFFKRKASRISRRTAKQTVRANTSCE